MKNILIGIFLIIIIILSGSTFYFYNQASRTPEKITQIVQQPTTITYINSAKQENDLIQQIPKDPKNSIDVTGWIPDWDMVRGLNSMKSHPSLFSRISPVFYGVNGDGSIYKYKSSFPDQSIMQYSKTNNIKVIPTISSFSLVTMNYILRDPTNLQRHVDSIVNEVIKNNYDGIDLDYESFEYNNKEDFFNFLTKLSQRLHSSNKYLVFTAVFKWGEKLNYFSFQQTRMVLDYKRIGDLVDELRIMAYDYYGKGSDRAGPMSPLNLDELSIKYAIFVGVPRNKIVLAIPLYGYDWSERALADDNIDPINIDPLTINSNGSDNPIALNYPNIKDLIQKNNMTSTFNTAWGLAVGRYSINGKNRIVVYENDQSISLRKQLVADYGIKGICYWTISNAGDLKL